MRPSRYGNNKDINTLVTANMPFYSTSLNRLIPLHPSFFYTAAAEALYESPLLGVRETSDTRAPALMAGSRGTSNYIGLTPLMPRSIVHPSGIQREGAPFVTPARRSLGANGFPYQPEA